MITSKIFHIIQQQSISKMALFLSICFIVLFRGTHVEQKEITWDVFGYYLPLPATFIYNDPLLENREWVDELNEKKQLTGTVYQISTTDDGKPMYFFLFGMSVFYSLFFFIGHILAGFTGFAQDGFSLPYQLAMVYGAIIYTIVGLVYLRKILRHFFTDKIAAIVFVLIVFATNYTHHLTLKNLETVNVLFMLCALLFWNTIQWHKTFQFKNLLGIGLSLSFMILVKPSELLLLFLPIFWGVYSLKTFKEKLTLIATYKGHFIVAIALCFLLFIPQLMYWQFKTGHFIYDSYKNPGVGLDFLNPHLIEALFSYKKGWLLYTPIAIFGLLGFFELKQKNPSLFPALLLAFFSSFYLVVSWTEWWYGAGFSIRPLITYYPLLAIPLGYFIVRIAEANKSVQMIFGSVFIVFTAFNQFQWWQLRNYILDPYYTTKDYYWATFLQTSVQPSDLKLKAFQRDFNGQQVFNNQKDYTKHLAFERNFNELAHSIYRSDSTEEFALTNQFPYQDLTAKDHAWIHISFRYKTDNKGEIPLFAMMLERKEGNYGYQVFDLKNTNKWESVSFYYLTPPIRSTKDELKSYFWKRSACNLEVDDFKLEVFSPKK